MAVEAKLGRANVAIRATLDQLDGDLSDARRNVDGAVSRMVSSAGRAFQGLGKAALGGIGIATGAVAGLSGILGKIAIDAAPVEGISGAFEGLAESAGYGADEMLAALQRGSAGMIAQRDLMMTFNEAAQLVSKDFAVQLPDAMEYLGKVSAATGQDMGFMLDSLVKGVGRLSPMILDNLGIQATLAEATERAAEMFGVEADELDKAQVQAGMMSVALEKLEANTAAMPDVTKSASARLAQMKARFQDVKDRIGMALLPVLTELIDTFSDLADRFLPPLMEAIEQFAPLVTDIATRIGEFVNALISGQEPVGAFKELIADLFPPEIAEKITAIVDGIVEFGQKVAEFLAPVIEWIEQNVKLQDILLVIGAAIATVVLPALVSILAPVLGIIAVFAGLVAAVAAVRTAWETDWHGIRTTLTDFWENTAKPAFEELWAWLQVSIPAAIETAKRFWEDTLQPALETVWAFIQESVIPALGELVTWLAENIPVAIEAAGQFWENTLKPALETVWTFITESVIPAMETIVLWLGENIPVAIEALADLWENTLKPALEIVWEFVENSLFPLFSALWELLDVSLSLALTALAGLWENVLKPALDTVWAFLDKNVNPTLEDLKDVFDSIAGAVETVIGWIGDLVEGLRNLELPDWLTPGSPTPFEIGLRGIGDAMRTLARTELPRLSVELQHAYGAEAVSRPDAGPGVNRQQIVIYGLTLEGVQDAEGLLEELQDMAI